MAIWMSARSMNYPQAYADSHAFAEGTERDQAWDLIREQLALGQRAYVVLPLVEESEKLDLRSAVEVHRHLADQVFPEVRWGCCTGASPARQNSGPSVPLPERPLPGSGQYHGGGSGGGCARSQRHGG